jgi:tetratricopeptide (TPR) repeat protein
VVFLLALLLIGCQPVTGPSTGPSAGPSLPTAELRRDYDDAFKAMMNRPDDLETVFRYADLAAKVGDLEGAIAAYEGMLVRDANLPRVRLELGVLYFRLKSYEVSRNYIETALRSPELEPELRQVGTNVLLQLPGGVGGRRT